MDDQLSWLQRQRLIPLSKPKNPRRYGTGEDLSVEEITNLSEDTIKRRYAHLIKKPSERRSAMKLGDALAIANGD